jgi:hypothetical protein
MALAREGVELVIVARTCCRSLYPTVICPLKNTLDS